MIDKLPLETTDEPRAERCETCRFWAGAKPDEADGIAKANLVKMVMSQDGEDEASVREMFDSWKDGTCHRYPPTAFNDAEIPNLQHDRFAATLFGDWCGEWQAKVGSLNGRQSHIETIEAIERLEGQLTSAQVHEEVCRHSRLRSKLMRLWKKLRSQGQ